MESMETAIKIKETNGKRQEMENLLKDYWGKDIWNVYDPFFDNLRPSQYTLNKQSINFSALCGNPTLRNEIKFMLASRVLRKEMRLVTVVSYSSSLIAVVKFLEKCYPKIKSILELPYEKALMRYRVFLSEQGYAVSESRLAVFSQWYRFFIKFYDTRTEFEKDVWDFRNIPGARYLRSDARYTLNFKQIPTAFRELTKRYIKFRSISKSLTGCSSDLIALRYFFTFIEKEEPMWRDLKDLTRKHMENFLSYYNSIAQYKSKKFSGYLYCVRTFIEYIQRAQYPEAPVLPVMYLIFNEDIPYMPPRLEGNVKYIPENVLQQVEFNLQYLTPADYIPVVLLLRASGWRISDILNLRYDRCIQRTSQGWYLCGDIPKVNALNHKVPITDDIAVVVQSVVEIVKQKSTRENNPERFLFVRYDGKRMGKPYYASNISRALNKLAEAKGIVGDNGKVFHFGNHAFRHTKGVELINNGMQLIHVQKWLAHASMEMTLVYARILDTTMRKSWEEATKQGLFRIDETGTIKKVDISAIQDEDVIEWEYIRHNLDAVRMPLGYCMKPRKQECHSQLNPCLTCRNLCTTPEFIPQYELEIQETKAVIERGKAQNRSVWVEKNQALLDRYECVL